MAKTTPRSQLSTGRAKTPISRHGRLAEIHRKKTPEEQAKAARVVGAIKKHGPTVASLGLGGAGLIRAVGIAAKVGLKAAAKSAAKHGSKEVMKVGAKEAAKEEAVSRMEAFKKRRAMAARKRVIERGRV